mgnify:CR=1 FL=1
MLSDTVIIEKLKNIVVPILEDERLELVDIEYKPVGKRWLLRVYIDKEQGVTIDDCAYVSREFARLLDVEDIIAHPYTLEVSSPGLTRPLRTSEDFKRNRGKRCRVITGQAIDGRNEFVGEIETVTADEVQIREKIGVVDIPIYAIKKAKLDFEL